MKRLVFGLLLGSGLLAGPRIAYGLPLHGDKLFASFQGSPDGSWYDPAVQGAMRLVVYTEVDLWSRAAQSIQIEDRDSVLDYASTVPRWERLSGQMQVDSPSLVILLWLESRWTDRHEHYLGRNTPEFLKWREWTSHQIRSLSAQVAEEQARYRHSRTEWEAVESTPMGRTPHEKPEDLTHLHGIWQQHHDEKIAQEEAEAKAKDPSRGMAAKVEREQGEYQKLLLSIMGAKK